MKHVFAVTSLPEVIKGSDTRRMNPFYLTVHLVYDEIQMATDSLFYMFL